MDIKRTTGTIECLSVIEADRPFRWTLATMQGARGLYFELTFSPDLTVAEFDEATADLVKPFRVAELTIGHGNFGGISPELLAVIVCD